MEAKGDSNLVVSQMNGTFKVKANNLQSLYNLACKHKSEFEEFNINHISRELNTRADHLSKYN